MILLDDQGHLASDTSVAELHAFARSLCLRPEWFQNHPDHPHYDLTTPRARRRAAEMGAVVVTPRELCRRCWRISRP